MCRLSFAPPPPVCGISAGGGQDALVRWMACIAPRLEEQGELGTPLLLEAVLGPNSLGSLCKPWCGKLVPPPSPPPVGRPARRGLRALAPGVAVEEAHFTGLSASSRAVATGPRCHGGVPAACRAPQPRLGGRGGRGGGPAGPCIGCVCCRLRAAVGTARSASRVAEAVPVVIPASPLGSMATTANAFADEGPPLEPESPRGRRWVSEGTEVKKKNRASTFWDSDDTGTLLRQASASNLEGGDDAGLDMSMSRSRSWRRRGARTASLKQVPGESATSIISIIGDSPEALFHLDIKPGTSATSSGEGSHSDAELVEKPRGERMQNHVSLNLKRSLAERMVALDSARLRDQPICEELDDRVVTVAVRQRASEAFMKHFKERGVHAFDKDVAREALASFGLRPPGASEAKAMAEVLDGRAGTTIDYAGFLELIEASRVAFRNVLSSEVGPLRRAWRRVAGGPCGGLTRKQCWHLLQELGVACTCPRREIEALLDAKQWSEDGTIGLVEAEHFVLRARELCDAFASRLRSELVEEHEIPDPVREELHDELLELHEAFEGLDTDDDCLLSPVATLHFLLDWGFLAGPTAHARAVMENLCEDWRHSGMIGFDRLVVIMFLLRRKQEELWKERVAETFKLISDKLNSTVDVSDVGTFLIDLELSLENSVQRDQLELLVKQAASGTGCGRLSLQEVQRFLSRVAECRRRVHRSAENEHGRSLSYNLSEVHQMRTAYELLESKGDKVDLVVSDIYRAVRRLGLKIPMPSVRRLLFEMEWGEEGSDSLSFVDFLRLVRLAENEVTALGEVVGFRSDASASMDMGESESMQPMITNQSSRGSKMLTKVGYIDCAEALKKAVAVSTGEDYLAWGSEGNDGTKPSSPHRASIRQSTRSLSRNSTFSLGRQKSLSSPSRNRTSGRSGSSR